MQNAMLQTQSRQMVLELNNISAIVWPGGREKAPTEVTLPDDLTVRHNGDDVTKLAIMMN